MRGTMTGKILSEHLVSEAGGGLRDRPADRPDAAPGRHRHHGLHGVRGPGAGPGPGRPGRAVRRPQHAPVRPPQRRRPPVPAGLRRPLRPPLLPGRQRHLPPGPHRAVRPPRGDPARGRLAHRPRAPAGRSPSAPAGSRSPWPWPATRSRPRPRPVADPQYTVKGGLNRIFEFTGPGVAGLAVTQRATVCNMITELGGTTAIFPSDRPAGSWPASARTSGSSSARTTTPATTRRSTSTWPPWSR